MEKYIREPASIREKRGTRDTKTSVHRSQTRNDVRSSYSNQEINISSRFLNRFAYLYVYVRPFAETSIIIVFDIQKIASVSKSLQSMSAFDALLPLCHESSCIIDTERTRRRGTGSQMYRTRCDFATLENFTLSIISLLLR